MFLDVPLKQGDTVVCAHGTGVLVECEGPDDPCVVEIEIGDVKHGSVFGAMKGNGADSGRVRRVPISFSHGARKGRKDQHSASIKAKVTLSFCLYNCSYVFAASHMLCDCS